MTYGIALCRLAFVAASALTALPCMAQGMPSTAGETLDGKRVVLADMARGHSTVLVAGFSREGGAGAGAWMKAVREDPALAGVAVFQIAMLGGAPSFIRGTIKNGMRKGLSADEQARFVVLTQDEKLWQKYFDVSVDKDPYVVLIDSNGNILWHGHGSAANLEPLLRTALR
jgi:hypothetical protein